jgi:ribonuclease HII
MAWMIGIDEAGYGPNLGPLVVAATVWRIEDAGSGERGAGRQTAVLATVGSTVNLYRRLRKFVSATPREDRLAIADSKVLYKPGQGLRLLERGVLTALCTVRGDATARWRDLFAACEPRLPWHAGFDCELPLDTTLAEIQELTDRFTSACGFAGVELVDVQTRLIFPRAFNDLTDHYGTKGAALSHITIGLLRATLEHLPPDPRPLTPAPCHVTCDKHGGRNHYTALLQHHFPDHWIDTLRESRAESRYAWGLSDRRVTVTFRVGGEAELPTALASMTAKYFRELAMRAFNDYWLKQVPGLRPTAGYPQDAKRFRAAIAGRQRELGIDDRDLWRNR